MEEQKNVVSRQQKRQQERDEKAYNEAMQKQMKNYANKGELMMIVEAFNKLRDRLFQLDIINSALEKIIITKEVCTRDEMQVAVKYEVERATKMKEVNETKDNYEERLKTCKEFDIVVDFTNIPNQILSDTKLTNDQKIELAEKYDIQIILDKLKIKEN